MMRALLSLVVALACGASACGSPASPSSAEGMALGRVIETASFEFRFAASDSVDVAWQEAYHAWAIAALGIPAPRRIRYYKYLSRAHMGTHTGNSNTNAFANPDLFEIHTIWRFDNHEVVHLYSSVWGHPVALWTEGLAVAFQTDPPAGDFVARWNRCARPFLWTTASVTKVMAKCPLPTGLSTA